MKFLFATACFLAGMYQSPVFAGVIVTQNVSPGATSWPGNPIVQTLADPASQTAVGESFNAVGGCTNYCQTFAIGATNHTLQAISIYAGGGTGTGPGTNIILRLFDLGTQTAPNPSPYAAFADLFNSGNGLSITYSPQTTGVLKFDFTGGDQVMLQAGHMYAFEIDGALNSSPLVWQRTISDTYSGGAAYRNRTWINGMNAREFALAVYAGINSVTNTGANTSFGPNGFAFHGFAATSSGINQDGANPAAGLAFADGVLCGTTLNGGAQGAGTAFCMSLDGTNFNVIRAFADAPDAANPQGDLTVSGNRFFGTTLGGGSSGVGVVLVGQTNGSASVLRSFAAVSADTATNSGGASPSALLVLAGGTLYGTASAGGSAANGTVFSLAANGTTFSMLHNFTALDLQTGTNTDGAVPQGGLILDGDRLYGVASLGAAGGNGCIFSVKTNGANYTVIHSFTPLDSVVATNADGAMPLGGLVRLADTIYGTTVAGGFGGRGVIFAVQTNGLGFAVLHHFTRADSTTGTNMDGASPCAALIISSNVLYGTASAGGSGGVGTVFSQSINGIQFHALHSFAALAGNGTNTDGAFPVAPVVRLANSLYGTTFSGGPGAAGTVFSILLPSSPAVITNIIRDAYGTVTLFFVGAAGFTNVIQTTASLTPPIAWLSVATNIADANGRWQFTDSNNTMTRFYRSYAP